MVRLAIFFVVLLFNATLWASAYNTVGQVGLPLALAEKARKTLSMLMMLPFILSFVNFLVLSFVDISLTSD